VSFSSGRNRLGRTGARGAALAATTLAVTGVATVAALFGSAEYRSAAEAAGALEGEPITIAEARQRSCIERERAGAAGVGTVTLEPELGDEAFSFVEARVAGPDGSDWDLAIFDASGERVTAAASTGSSEVASGFVASAEGLTVQVCRLSGAGETGELALGTTPVAAEQGKSSLVLVQTPNASAEQELTELGLDLTEHGGKGFIGVVVHGAEDRETLDRAGFKWETAVGNLARQSARERATDERYATRVQRSALPSQSDTYRDLADFQQEMKDLADANPAIVRPLTLAHETYEGRTVEGIEITTDVNNLRDGKPVFLQMGTHHAREWPSAEHAMEWAYELINGYNANNERARKLVESTRTIVIPVVNPDGFNTSREAGKLNGNGGGKDGTFLTSFPTAPNEYRRKNCRLFTGDASGNCAAQPALGIQSLGVDPNRNYGGFWGGPGASDLQVDEDYRGPGPFSEPESQNIRELVSARQVTTLITNHTFSNLVLRPPSLSTDPPPVDEEIYKALGARMAAENGYLNQASYELYDTSGGTEDWSYFATGGLGFTFEIGCNNTPDLLDPRCSGDFHPTYPKVIDEYEGTSPNAQAVGGRGNREAYFIAHEFAADPANHSLLQGEAPAGAVLKIEKSFTTPTRNEEFPSVDDHLESELKVPDSGKFEWHINPSTRPLVAQSRGRQAQGPPSGETTATPATGNSTTTVPPLGCANIDTEDANCWNDHVFTVDGGAGVDNDSATVSLDWAVPTNDWDMKVYRDSDNDGSSVGETEIGQSGNSPPATNESVTINKPEAGDGRLEPGQYVVRVINYAAPVPDDYTVNVSFEGPEEFVPATTETWKFTCTFAGETRVTQEILIARGERQTLDLALCGTGAGAGADSSCQGKKATLVGSKGSDAIIGSKGADVIVGLGGNDKLRGRGGNDVICAKGGRDNVGPGAGNDRVTLGGGNDRANGAKGNDKIRGGVGKDRIAGGKGKDRLSGNGGKDRLRGGKGPDRLRGGGGTDRCNGGKGRDREKNC
jgi:Ca2+-binding RTX toxin-like protein